MDHENSVFTYYTEIEFINYLSYSHTCKKIITLFKMKTPLHSILLLNQYQMARVGNRNIP